MRKKKRQKKRTEFIARRSAAKRKKFGRKMVGKLKDKNEKRVSGSGNLDQTGTRIKNTDSMRVDQDSSQLLPDKQVATGGESSIKDRVGRRPNTGGLDPQADGNPDPWKVRGSVNKSGGNAGVDSGLDTDVKAGANLLDNGLDIPDIEIPDHLLYMSVFSSLDSGIPLAMLPVKIEARYYLKNNPPELRLRIFPDQVHADGHIHALTQSEIGLGKAYWTRYWRYAGDDAIADEAFTWLAGNLDAWRAAWVIKQTQPRNMQELPSQPLAKDEKLADLINWPKINTTDSGQANYARLLPERWAVIGYENQEEKHVWWGNSISTDLPMAPGLIDVPEDIDVNWDVKDWLDSQGLGWTYDFDKAESVGMGVRIDLSAFPSVQRNGFSELLVIGVRGDNSKTHTDIRELLEAQFYTHGLDIIAQGSATNNTDTASSAVSPDNPDLTKLRKTVVAELNGSQSTGRPRINKPEELYQQTSADALSLAMGVTENALDYGEHASEDELNRARAMNKVLWPATFDYYFSSPLKNVVKGDNRSWLRDWFVNYVRGGSLLSTFRIGSQPYGVLPVSLIQEQTNANTNKEQLERIVFDLWQSWLSSVHNISHLDPDLTDVGANNAAESENEIVSALAQVLGAVPHPTNIRLRKAFNEYDAYNGKYAWRLGLLFAAMLFAPDENGNFYQDENQNPCWQEWETADSALNSAASVYDQIIALQRLHDFLDARRHLANLGEEQKTHASTYADFVETHLLDFLEAHESRIDPAMALGLSREITGLMPDKSDPSTFFSLYDEEGEEEVWRTALVADNKTAEAVEEVRNWLNEVYDVVTQNRDISELPSPNTLMPLLKQMIIRSASVVNSEDRELLAEGIESLIAFVDGSESTDPISELERLLREVVGLTINRIDAWASSLAARQLGLIRKQQRTGLQVGAYGWLVEVKPATSQRASQGYIFAPTMSHATTAAILRSGWSAYGANEDGSELATNLSSERLRRARWVIDGVRGGQELGELLGARFERRLHDSHLDQWIYDIREAVLTASGSKQPANSIVDGLLLSRAYSGADDLTNEEEKTKIEVDKVLNSAGADQARLDQQITDTVVDLDATSDALMAQSIHALAHGNTAEAAASLSATGSGDSAVPKLSFSNIPRQAQSIIHRLAITLKPDDVNANWPGADYSGRVLAAPHLESWLEILLGDPANIIIQVQFEEADPLNLVTSVISLAQLELSALDFIMLCPSDDKWQSSKFYRFVVAKVRQLFSEHVTEKTEITLNSDFDNTNQFISMANVFVATRPLRGILQRSRHLDARDLLHPDEATGLDQHNKMAINLSDLEQRLNAIKSLFESMRIELESSLPPAEAGNAQGDIYASMLRTIGFPLPGQVPTTSNQAVLVSEGENLLLHIKNRLEKLAALESADSETWNELSADNKALLLIERIAKLLGRHIPVCPLFTPVNTEAVKSSLEMSDVRLHTVLHTSSWLNQVGHTRSDTHRFNNAVDLLEACFDDSLFNYQLAQLPHHPSESWVATTIPGADLGSRLCFLSTGEAIDKTLLNNNVLCGLLVDSWSDAIPEKTIPTGIATHFDSPGARPPQVILLAVTNDESGWDFSRVKNIVKQTLDMARTRLVGMEHLEKYGQFLPVTYLAGDTKAGSGSVKFDDVFDRFKTIESTPNDTGSGGSVEDKLSEVDIDGIQGGAVSGSTKSTKRKRKRKKRK